MSPSGRMPIRYRALTAFLMLLAIVTRTRHIDRPIVEGYVGRQIPTAMVARNLDRGSGFFRPQLDTGPFPNLFLVEPPVFAALTVALKRLTGLEIGASGRAVSALATALAVWGLMGLAWRRDGLRGGLVGCVFLLLPATLRYGRACQPDALMIGLIAAGMRLWDDHEAEGGPWRLAGAWGLLATGLAVKVVAAPILIPLALAIARPPTRRKLLAIASTLAPALLWYLYATSRLRMDGGSRASADNAAFWARALLPTAWLRPDTFVSAARLAVRSFTPLGLPLAAWGLFALRGADRLWRVWFLAAGAGLALLPGKLHHDYYGLLLAPSVAAGMAQAAWVGPWTSPRDAIRRGLGGALVAASLTVGMLGGERAYDVPAEWAEGPALARAIDRDIPRDDLVIAPEAILYLADRRGCRLEYEPRSALRAAGEWGGRIDPDDPLALVEFYRTQGARFVADLWPVAEEPNRRALHDAIRRRYNVKIDRDGVILAELVARPAR